MAYGLTATSRNMGGGPTGFAICNRTGPAQTMPPDSLSWPGCTMFRPLAIPNADLTGQEPWFDADSQIGFNGWIHMGRVARKVGNRPNKSVTYFNQLPESQVDDFDAELGLPYDRVFDYIKQKSDEEAPGYAKLMKGGDGRGACVSRVSVAYIIQAAVYRKERREGKALTWEMPNYNAILLTRTAGSVIDRLAFPNKQDPEELSKVFGNLFDPKSRTMICLHSNQKDLAFPVNEKWNIMADSHTEEEAQGDSNFGSFYCGHLLDSPEKFGIPTAKEAAKRFVPWHDLIRIPTVEEQVRLLCSAFTPEILCAALGDSEYRDFLTDPVKVYLASGVVAVTVAVPAAMPTPTPAAPLPDPDPVTVPVQPVAATMAATVPIETPVPVEAPAPVAVAEAPPEAKVETSSCDPTDKVPTPTGNNADAVEKLKALQAQYVKATGKPAE